MSFKFYSAGKVLEVAPFRTEASKGETEAAAYTRKKETVMQWLAGFSNRQVLGNAYHPLKDAFPDDGDMAVIKTTDPGRWQQLEQDAIADLALNGCIAQVPELTLVSPPVPASLGIPTQRAGAETFSHAQQPAA